MDREEWAAQSTEDKAEQTVDTLWDVIADANQRLMDAQTENEHLHLTVKKQERELLMLYRELRRRGVESFEDGGGV